MKDSYKPVWAVELPLGQPLTLNDRAHHMERARDVRKIREITGWAVRGSGIRRDLGRVHVTVIVTPPDRRRRDRHNLHATVKPILDGIVDAGIIPDDTPDHLAGEELVLEEPDGSKQWRWQLRIAEVD